MILIFFLAGAFLPFQSRGQISLPRGEKDSRGLKRGRQNLNNPKIVYTLQEKSPVQLIQFSPDARIWIIITKDKRVSIRETYTGKEICSLEQAFPIQSVLFTRDGRKLLLTTHDAEKGGGLVSLFEASTGKNKGAFHTQLPINDVCLSADDSRLLTGSGDNNNRKGNAVLWELETGKDLRRFPHEGSVFKVDFAPDGRHMFTGWRKGKENGGAIIWNMETGKKLAFFDQEGYVKSSALSPGGSHIALGWEHPEGNGFVAPWEIQTRQKGHAMNQGRPVLDVRFSPDGREVQTLWKKNQPGAMEFISIGTTKSQTPPLFTMETFDEKSGRVLYGKRYVVSNEALWIEHLGFRHNISLWDTWTGRKSQPLVMSGKTIPSLKLVAWSPDGMFIITYHENGELHLWRDDKKL